MEDERESSLRLRVEVLKRVFDEATEGMLIVSYDHSIYYYNKAFKKILGFPEDREPGFLLEEYLEFLGPKQTKMIRERLDQTGTFRGELPIRRLDGSEGYILLTIETIVDEKGNGTYRFVNCTDLSELKQMEESLERSILQDALTGLPNRLMLLNTLEESIERSRKTGGRCALISIDLDQFKQINDTLGHRFGDQVIVALAERIEDHIRESDLFGRIGGDEFLIILQGPRAEAEKVMNTVDALQEDLSRPLILGEREYSVGASIGIALCPDDAANAADLLKYADMALFRAKELGGKRSQFYSEEINASFLRRFEIEHALSRAIQGRNFHLVFQPQYDLASARIIGVEALVRFDEGVLPYRVSPAEFIPIAESVGLIVPIGRIVLEESCRIFRDWKAQGIGGVQLSVNLSRKQLGDETFVSFVRECLERYAIASHEVEFEITETALMTTDSNARELIHSLRSMGCRIAVDDFGTGYSNLGVFKEFTVDRIKIDRSFITDLPDSETDRAIVGATIVMAKVLGLRVVAEGVESDDQLGVLRILGCDETQGNYFMAASDPDDVLDVLLKERRIGKS
ncbi:putative bifunctional diguanylate cyclase/phosphodiesterase [Nitratifractor sp.]